MMRDCPPKHSQPQASRQLQIISSGRGIGGIVVDIENDFQLDNKTFDKSTNIVGE